MATQTNGGGNGNGNGKGPSTPLTNTAVAHLTASGLTQETIATAQLRAATLQELPQSARMLLPDTKAIDHFIIPYFTLTGERITDFYRIRLLPALEVPSTEGRHRTIRYYQPGKTQQHLYVPPPGILPPEVWGDTSVPVFITEGEKKVLALAQLGYAVLGSPGVDSWRNRTFELEASQVEDATPKKSAKAAKAESEAESKNGAANDAAKAAKPKPKKIRVKLESHAEAELFEEGVAPELMQIEWTNRDVYIVFDSDTTPKPQVQRAAFELGLWLDGHGARVKQIKLPANNSDKTGIDDYLVTEGPKAFEALLAQKWNFPTHPNLKSWVMRQLNSSGAKRATYLQVARGILADLDEIGQRFRDGVRNYYYFNNDTKALNQFRWDRQEISQFRLSDFGTLLYGRYNLGTADAGPLARLADMFTATPPLSQVQPRRVSHAVHQPGKGESDILYYQLSDSRVAKITARSISAVDNGTDGVLFLSDQVQPLDEEEIADALAKHPEPQNLWLKALSSLNVTPFGGLNKQQTCELFACLYYISPWLRRWRGLMLPIEFLLAEPSSGKSSTLNLRRGVYSGRATLDNAPVDIRDFFAAISSAPGMYIVDNLNELRREVRDRISDEIARLITDPDPSFELRQLFTTSDSIRQPVDCTFAVSSVWPVFHRTDILQRSITLNLEEIPPGQRNSDWYQEQLRHRPEWIAEHLLVMQRFFQTVEKFWRPNYLAHYRLAHFEQTVTCMAITLGLDPRPLISGLSGATEEVVTSNDANLLCLQEFALDWVKRHGRGADCRIQDIVNWVSEDVEGKYANLSTFRSPITLGRYLNSIKHQIERSTGIRLSKGPGGVTKLTVEVKPR